MRLQATLTKPQADFFVSEAKYPAFVGGFGSGKSETLAQRAIADAAHSGSALIGVYAPTYDLLKLVNVTRIELKLHEHGIRHKWHSQDKAIYTSHPGFGDFIFRTMDAPERIIGFETFRAHADELDTLKTEHARTAWNQIIARNRQVLKDRPGAQNRASAYTTPEGFRFTHDRWVVNATPDYRLYRAPTHSNPFLPADYIDGLRASYPAQLIDAYIEGQFVNLTSGTVYSSYDQAPVGTLPNDQELLAKMLLVDSSHFQQLCRLEYGPLHKWRLMRCGDEVRLAHPMVLRSLQEAIARREDNRAKNDAANIAKRIQRLRITLLAYNKDIGGNDAAVRWIDGWLSDEGCEYRSSSWIERGISRWMDHSFALTRKGASRPLS